MSRNQYDADESDLYEEVPMHSPFLSKTEARIAAACLVIGVLFAAMVMFSNDAPMKACLSTNLSADSCNEILLP